MICAAQLLERAALRAVLVLLVELRDLGVGHRLRALRRILRHERLGRLARGLGGVLDQDVAHQLLEHVAAVLVEQLRHARALGGVELFPLRVELFERDLRPPTSATTWSGLAGAARRLAPAALGSSAHAAESPPRQQRSHAESVELTLHSVSLSSGVRAAGSGARLVARAPTTGNGGYFGSRDP